ncbi:MAG: hypothetical protein WA744_00510, partial [Candidatus Acidiferrales bacterium]
YSGNDIKIDDEEYMILKEDEILAKIGPTAKAAGGKKSLPGQRRLRRNRGSAAGPTIQENRKRR